MPRVPRVAARRLPTAHVKAEGTRWRRWWVDPESERLARAVADKLLTYHLSPVLRGALAHLAATAPTTDDLIWLEQTALPDSAHEARSRQRSWVATRMDVARLEHIQREEASYEPALAHP
jgi:hypothetical protein